MPRSPGRISRLVAGRSSEQRLHDRRGRHSLRQALRNPFNQEPQRLIGDGVAPLPRRLKRCANSLTSVTRLALVTEKRIRYQAQVPVTPDTT